MGEPPPPPPLTFPSQLLYLWLKSGETVRALWSNAKSWRSKLSLSRPFVELRICRSLSVIRGISSRPYRDRRNRNEIVERGIWRLIRTLDLAGDKRDPHRKLIISAGYADWNRPRFPDRHDCAIPIFSPENSGLIGEVFETDVLFDTGEQFTALVSRDGSIASNRNDWSTSIFFLNSTITYRSIANRCTCIFLCRHFATEYRCDQSADFSYLSEPL